MVRATLGSLMLASILAGLVACSTAEQADDSAASPETSATSPEVAAPSELAPDFSDPVREDDT
jgi:hypothetical protein